MNWLFAALGGVGFVELLLRLPVRPKLAALGTTVSRVSAVVRSRRISDHWKEKALLRHAFRLFGTTAALAMYFLGAFVPCLVFHVVSLETGTPFLEFAVSPVGILFLTAVSTGYAGIRYRHVAQQL